MSAGGRCFGLDLGRGAFLRLFRGALAMPRLYRGLSWAPIRDHSIKSYGTLLSESQSAPGQSGSGFRGGWPRSKRYCLVCLGSLAFDLCTRRPR